VGIVSHKEALDRLRRTFALLRPGNAPRPAHRADHLIKMNLAPLMGRRDAALDHASKMICSDIFLHNDDEWRAYIYITTAKLLSNAETDTRALLSVLNSPDTAAREKNILNLLMLTRSIALTLCDFTELESGLLGDDKTTLNALAANPTDSELARSEKTISDSGVNLVNQLRALFERSRPRMARYREYSRKSFSESYAARYLKAFDAYTKVYTDAYPLETGNQSTPPVIIAAAR